MLAMRQPKREGDADLPAGTGHAGLSWQVAGVEFTNGDQPGFRMKKARARNSAEPKSGGVEVVRKQMRSESKKSLTADELYRLAGTAPTGTARWEEEHGVRWEGEPWKGSDVYVVSLADISSVKVQSPV